MNSTTLQQAQQALDKCAACVEARRRREQSSKLAIANAQNNKVIESSKSSICVGQVQEIFGRNSSS